MIHTKTLNTLIVLLPIYQPSVMCALNEDVCEAVCLSPQRKDTWVQTVTYTVTLLKSHGNTLQRMNTCFHENNVINLLAVRKSTSDCFGTSSKEDSSQKLSCAADVKSHTLTTVMKLLWCVALQFLAVMYATLLEKTQENCVRTKNLCVDSPLVPATVRLVSLTAERMCLHCSL